MKILLCNSNDSGGGAARAARRLHQGLREAGVESVMLTQNATAPDPSILAPPTQTGRLLTSLRPHLDALPLKLYPGRRREVFSPALLPERAGRRIRAQQPDIVHLHWICEGFMRPETLAGLGRPLVWTLHDSWAFTGGCHIPGECVRYRRACGACPLLGSRREADLSRILWRRKRRAWRNLDLTLIAPSAWLAGCATSSSLFQDTRIEVIPNGIDVRLYRPIPRQTARELLGLPQDRGVILFGGVAISGDRNKGGDLLMAALGKLTAARPNPGVDLVIFGAETGAFPNAGLNTHYLGRLRDDISLSLAYSAADLFVLPSRSENLPNTIMEAMACAVPCVAFNQGGVPGMVSHRETGYLAAPESPEDLAAGMAWLLDDRTARERCSRNSRTRAESEYAIGHVVRRHLELYRELLER